MNAYTYTEPMTRRAPREGGIRAERRRAERERSMSRRRARAIKAAEVGR